MHIWAEGIRAFIGPDIATAFDIWGCPKPTAITHNTIIVLIITYNYKLKQIEPILYILTLLFTDQCLLQQMRPWVTIPTFTASELSYRINVNVLSRVSTSVDVLKIDLKAIVISRYLALQWFIHHHKLMCKLMTAWTDRYNSSYKLAKLRWLNKKVLLTSKIVHLGWRLWMGSTKASGYSPEILLTIFFIGFCFCNHSLSIVKSGSVSVSLTLPTHSDQPKHL